MMEFQIEILKVNVELWKERIGVCFPCVDYGKIVYVRHDWGVVGNLAVTYLRV